MKTNWTVGARLGGAFALVLSLLAALIAVAVFKSQAVADINRRIVEEDWVKADAANSIKASTRDNARRTMELLLIEDPAELAKVNEAIARNKKAIDDALASLDKLVYRPEGKALLAKLRETRAAYVASFSRVAKLVAEGRKDQGLQLLRAETLPALDKLQGNVDAFAEFQRKLVLDSSAEVMDNVRTARAVLLSFGVIALLLGVAASVLITRGILRQLGGEPEYAADIAKRIAGGDLTVAIELRPGDDRSLLFAMRAMRDSLATIVRRVREGTSTIASASSQIASGNMDLSSRTEEQASSLEETAASMEELTSTVRNNADNARQSQQLTEEASRVAHTGGAVMAQVVGTMASISESAKKIADIIGVIDGIAFQTNILALNAAVEAARAGEQGRGFAVVASEVRNLAQRSASAAKEIKHLISDSVDKVESGGALVSQAGKTMDEVVASVKRVRDIMQEIAAASQEQSSGIEQVNQAVGQMDQVTQQNAALVEEAAAAAASLQDQARQLEETVNVFKLEAALGRGHQPVAAPAVVAVRAPASANRSASRGARAVPARAAATSAPRRVVTGGASQDWEQF